MATQVHEAGAAEPSLNARPAHLPSQTPLSAAARLRDLLAEEGKIVVCPGVYDGFTARIALKAGFDCLYMVNPLLS